MGEREGLIIGEGGGAGSTTGGPAAEGARAPCGSAGQHSAGLVLAGCSTAIEVPCCRPGAVGGYKMLARAEGDRMRGVAVGGARARPPGAASTGCSRTMTRPTS
jgi:hypothetical protein